jgi:hypothetical protein
MPQELAPNGDEDSLLGGDIMIMKHFGVESHVIHLHVLHLLAVQAYLNWGYVYERKWGQPDKHFRAEKIQENGSAAQ